MRTEAEILADARPGAAFSNSTAYEIWAAGPAGCYSCKHDETGYAPDGTWCPILGVALLHNRTPAEWPDREYQTEYGPGHTIGDCAEYERGEERGPDDDPPPDPGPDPDMPGQVDIFSHTADKMIEELSTVDREKVEA